MANQDENLVQLHRDWLERNKLTRIEVGDLNDSWLYICGKCGCVVSEEDIHVGYHGGEDFNHTGIPTRLKELEAILVDADRLKIILGNDAAQRQFLINYRLAIKKAREEKQV